MNVVTGEFKDLASCFLLNVNYSGTLAVLAGHKVCGLVQLNSISPYVIARRSGKGSNSQYHPVQDIKFQKGHDQNVIAEASANKVILHDCTQELDPSKSIEFYAHKRNITSIDWNGNTNLLASSSLDNLLNIWDTRKKRQTPTININCSTPAGKISWEKIGGNILASTHESQLRIWDIRGKRDRPLGIYNNSENDLGPHCFGNNEFFNARSRRILSIDFSPTKENMLVTGSADSVVRIVEVNKINNNEAADVIFQLPQKRWPVVNVKQTPFGNGIVTLAWNKYCNGVGSSANSRYNIYQSRENNVTLWTTCQNERIPAGSSVHTFYGHSDVILDQDWLVDRRLENDLDFKLVTWSKDSTLKVWDISDNAKEMCGHEDGLQGQDREFVKQMNPMVLFRKNSEEPSKSDSTFTKDTGYRSQSAVSSHSKDSENDNIDELQDEEMGLNGNGSVDQCKIFVQSVESPVASDSSPTNEQSFLAGLSEELSPYINGRGFGDRISIESSDLQNDPYTILVGKTINHHVYLKVRYPKGYPILGESPQFSIIKGTSLDQTTAFEIQRKLQISADHLASKNQTCLGTCFRLFEGEIATIYQKEKDIISTPSNKIKLPKGNDAIPFPRTSGGRFCGLGQLVCFGWAYSVEISNLNPDESTDSENLASRLARTPRALSALNDSSHLMTAQVQMIGNAPSYNSGKISASLISTSSDGSLQQVSSMAASQLMSNFCRQPSRVSFDTKLSLMTMEKEMNMFNQYMQYQNRFSSDQEISSLESSPRKISTSEEPKKVVTVYDTLKLLPFDKKLAESYQLCGPDLKNVCVYNSQVALKHGYRKIAACWNIVANCCKEDTTKFGSSHKKDAKTERQENEYNIISRRKGRRSLFMPWVNHPDGKKLLNEIVLKCTNTDIQTAAMICSVFAKATNKNVHVDGGGFFSTFVEIPSKRNEKSFSRSMEAIVRRNKEIIHSESNPKAAAIAARQLRKAQRFKGLRNLSECQSESQDRRSFNECKKESGSVASDGDNQLMTLSNTKHQGIGDRIASSVANTNLLNIPGILLNFTSKSPTRKGGRSISMMGLNRSYSDANFAEEIDNVDNAYQNKTGSDLNFSSDDINYSDETLLDPINSHVYDQYKRLYAELLYRCNMPEKAVEIMHLMTNKSSIEIGSFIMNKSPNSLDCLNCHREGLLNSSFNSICSQCKSRKHPKCVYCRLPVKGHVSACLACGHGGHLSHMIKWFESNKYCASSCGCNCLDEMENFHYT